MKKQHQEKYRRLGLNIAFYRRSRGYTQQQLAELVGIERCHISAIEQARKGASMDLIFCLCTVLDVTPEELFDFR